MNATTTMRMTPRTTKSPCFLRKVLGSSPWASRAPRVAVYTMMTPMAETKRVATTSIKSTGGTLRRLATCVRASVVIWREARHNIGRDLPPLGASPCPGGVVGPGAGWGFGWILGVVGAGQPGRADRADRPGRRLALPPLGEVRGQHGHGVDGDRPDRPAVEHSAGGLGGGARRPLRRQGAAAAVGPGRQPGVDPV